MPIRTLVAFFLILGLWPMTAASQSDALMQAYRQGKALEKAGRYREAIPYYRRVLQFGEREFGVNHPTTATLIVNLAGLYFRQGHFDDAEPLIKRSLAIRERVHGPNHPDVSSSLNNLALLHKEQGRYGEAEPLMRRSLAISERMLGPNHADVATSLNNLAALYQVLGRYGDAVPLYKRSLTIIEKTLGPNHPNFAANLNNLATLYQKQGRYSDAEPLYDRALAIMESILGPTHPDVAGGLNTLAMLYQAQGRYGDAEPLLKRSLAIREKALGRDHIEVAASLHNLATLFDDQGRHLDAEPLLRHSISIFEKALGADHPHVATGLNSLALLYKALGRYSDAEPLLGRSLAIREKALGPHHAEVAATLNNLADLYQNLNRPDEAVPLLKRSVAIKEKTLGPEHPSLATSLSNLAVVYFKQERYGEAESLLKRSVSIKEKTLGPDHPSLATSLHNLASLYQAQEINAKALVYNRQAVAIHRDRIMRAGLKRSGGGQSERKKIGYIFVSLVVAAWNEAKGEPTRRLQLASEAFEAGQLARATSTAAAIAGMGARFAAGDDALAGLVRELQDASEQWRRADKEFVNAVSRPPAVRDSRAEERLRDKLDRLDRNIGNLNGRLAQEFPEFGELTKPRPVPLHEVQALLGPDEALLAYVVAGQAAPNHTFLWVARRDRAAMLRLEIGEAALNEKVSRLRAGLDPSKLTNLADIPAFDTSLAHELYAKIFAPTEKMLDGVRHVFVVPDAALQSFPMGVLVTGKPNAPVDKIEDYRSVSWLALRYATSILPSVSSLRALRKFAKRATPTIPITGFGDPLLRGHPGGNRGLKLASLYRGSIADVEAVRNLAPLPDTADELRALAAAVKGDMSQIHLRTAATETKVKSIDLSNSRIVTFATHGLVAGNLQSAEPALVLTPPRRGTALDDGLLTASEVAQLKLNADLVILSACNTAASDGTPGADALSGLAKAFFYAGSRTLLVSHWPVFSSAAVKLTTKMLSARSAHPSVTIAEALRRSMVSLMNDPKNKFSAHPMFWAPFVLVGEGGAPKATR